MNKPIITVEVDMVCDSQADIEQAIAHVGFNDDIKVVNFEPDGPAGGCPIVTIEGDVTAVFNCLVALGFDEEMAFDLLPEAEDGLEWAFDGKDFIVLNDFDINMVNREELL